MDIRRSGPEEAGEDRLRRPGQQAGTDGPEQQAGTERPERRTGTDGPEQRAGAEGMERRTGSDSPAPVPGGRSGEASAEWNRFYDAVRKHILEMEQE